MKKIISLSLILFFVASLSAQAPNGTYVPITDMAKQLQFAKFVFSGSTVKIYLGMNGVSFGVASECSYSMKGNAILIKEGATSIEVFTYDKGKDQIAYNMEASYELLGQFGAALGQTNDKKVDSKEVANAFEQLGIAPPVWGKEGTVYELPMPKETAISPPAPKRGKLVFLVHGLSRMDMDIYFRETVISLLGYGNYHHYGRVSASFVSPDENKAQYINQLTGDGKNVLVRLEFSEGNLSFAKQLEEMRKMVAIFHGQNADVVFVGHSMGGLASINYGVEYADTYRGVKTIKIITVSTPFNDNNWAKVDVRNFFAGAKWDLGGGVFNNALSNLKSKWIEYKGKIRSIELHTIGIIASSNNVSDRNNRGDGIIDISTQLGADWSSISSKFTINRDDNNNTKIDVWDTKDPYHHGNTANLLRVAERIREIIE